MKTSLLLAGAFAASVNSAVIEARQRPRPTYPDVTDCGLDSFVGHTSEALQVCSSILKSGTATRTAITTTRVTTTVKTTTIITLYPPTSVPAQPTPTTTPTSTASSTSRSTSTSTLSSTSRSTPISTPPGTTAQPPTTTVQPPSTTVQPPTTSPSPTSGCGLAGYVGNTAAYYFDSTGTKNTFAACSAACKADAQCKSFGYGEANCLLFNVPATGNTNYNPMSPYTFYDVSCPKELPVRKRQVDISIGFGISSLSSACSCFIGSGPASTTTTRFITTTDTTKTTQTLTRTVSLLPDRS